VYQNKEVEKVDGVKLDPYQGYIHISRYSRYLNNLKRREVWPETVGRYGSFFTDVIDKKMSKEDAEKAVREFNDVVLPSILMLEDLPSMRSLMCAGIALERDNVAGYSCSYTAIKGAGKKIELTHDEIDEPIEIHLSNPIDFDEMMYILLCGTGVGYSVERQYISNLPKVGKKLNRRGCLPNNKNFNGVPREEISTLDKRSNTIHVHDSKYGWASSLRILLFELYNGNFDVSWDVSSVRPKGAPLKTFGGRASGPEPLVELFTFAKEMFKRAYGRKLTSLECHDLCCKIGDVVVVGGVRRAACLSLSNLSDQRMATAKSGNWWETEPQRRLANNSVCYTERPDVSQFMQEWINLYNSKSGERGFFSRVASERQAAKNKRRAAYKHFGTNPCSEIILRQKQFCNLSTIVVRASDTLEELKKKARNAAIMGTLQATLTDFKYLSPEWKANTEDEALLGVSMTGIMDHLVLSKKQLGFPCGTSLEAGLEGIRQVVIDTNKEWASMLGIKQAAAATCVKPEGTASQLVDASSGMHARFSEYYIRRVRGDMKDPLTQWMAAEGFPWEVDVMNPSNAVFSFPIKAPEGCTTTDELSAIDQLNFWKTYQDHWCEHKPSITIYYSDDEFMEVGAWLWKNFDSVSGVSFLPRSDHTYKQAPYEAITKEEYHKMLSEMPNVDWDNISLQEDQDNAQGVQTLACTAGNCEI